jgi:hypothetical protein
MLDAASRSACSVTDNMQNLLYGRRGWVLRWDVWPYIVSGVDGEELKWIFSAFIMVLVHLYSLRLCVRLPGYEDKVHNQRE